MYLCCQGSLTSLAQDRLFADEHLRARYDWAVRLNRERHYMEAYDSLRTLHRDMLRTIKQHNLSAGMIPDTKDFIFYQNVLISKAQCAYKVNLWSEMDAICLEQQNIVNERYLNGLGQNSDYYWQIASYYKTLGDYYFVKGAENSAYYSEAKKQYDEALAYYEKAQSKKEMRMVYAELAQLEYAQKHYDGALKYIEMAIGADDTSRMATGTNAKVSFTQDEENALNISYQSALAMCQAQTMDFRGALRTIDQTIAKLPRKSKQLPELKRMRAKILLLQNEYLGTDIMEAVELYEEYFKAIKDTVSSNFMQMTADQREEYWIMQRPFVVDCYQLEEHNPALLYDVTLYNKGMLLQTARSFDNLLYDGTGKRADEKGKLLALRQQDASNAMEGNTTTLASDYERQLLQTMSVDGRRKKFFRALSYTWKDIQKALPAEGCAIEFIEYERGYSTQLGALLLKKKGAPKFVHICDATNLLDETVGGWFFSLSEQMSFTDNASKNEIYQDEELRDKIWTNEIIEAIGDCKKVYFSPDGFLHQLAIEYMLPDSLAEKKFYRLTSTRVLAEGNRIDAKKIQYGAAFVLGGIYYDSFLDEEEADDPGNDATAFNSLQKRGASFSYMEGAKIECDSILYYRNNLDDLYLLGLEATEHMFYENCNKYPILHLSTHGSFSGSKAVSNTLLASSSKDVLSESVLALSKANTNLRNNDFDAFNKDGILSAKEVARLNLDNVELVTTSACQTGLGYITADGIYGMQRGFKSAGAKGMVMTLWSVNIESARIFFTAFYRYMSQGESLHAAFMHARNDLLTKTYTIPVTVSVYNAGTLSTQRTSLTKDYKFDAPQHSCPYLLIDVWE